MEPLSIQPPVQPAAARGAPDPLAAQAGAPGRPETGFSVKSLDRLLGEAVDPVELTSVKIQLDVDDSTKRVVATVFDRETGEVLNQFPAEAILENARGIRELLVRELDIRV